ncbi:MAG: hypothetical protein H6Q13_3537 [Bacteroidetes bacterium]|nr:hypothetical protein [Bacteroidota bacterium]
MKDTIYSKLSLFDILAMFIPGGIFMAIIVILPENNLTIKSYSKFEEIFVYTFIIALIYLIGLIHNCLMDKLFSCLRNNVCLIRLAYNCINNTNETDGHYPCIFYRIRMFLYFDKIQCISICFYESMKRFLGCEERENNDGDNLKQKYYKAYYYVALNSISQSIPILESQFVFVRNMILPIFIVVILFWNQFCLKVGLNSSDITLTYRIIFIFSLFLVMFSKLYKIHKLVWEDSRYIKEIKG